MILWKFKADPETRGEHMPNSAFRWTLQIGWAFFGFFHQCRDRKSGAWENSDVGYYQICFWRRAMFGIHHGYYDGPHCLLALGWLRFEWTGDPRTGWCEKCMPSDEAN